MSRFSPIRSSVVSEPETDVSPPAEIQPIPQVFADSQRFAGNHLSTPCTLTFNQAKNGLQLHFPDKPDEDIRAELKAAGWRWSFRNHCWYHRDTPANRDFAEQFVAKLNHTDAEARSRKVEPNVIPVPAPANNDGYAPRPIWRQRLAFRK